MRECNARHCAKHTHPTQPLVDYYNKVRRDAVAFERMMLKTAINRIYGRKAIPDTHLPLTISYGRFYGSHPIPSNLPPLRVGDIAEAFNITRQVNESGFYDYKPLLEDTEPITIYKPVPAAKAIRDKILDG